MKFAAIVGLLILEYAIFKTFGSPLIDAQERCELGRGCLGVLGWGVLLALAQLSLAALIFSMDRASVDRDAARRELEELRQHPP